MTMHLHITTILFIILEHINRIFTQGIPISPCPKMFQYRFDGTEWFGILSVRNPDFGQALHLRVTLSMRGKPTTNYLGEIELLTRGQFLGETPVLYKIKFPRHHFPPKVLQITANNHVVCLGAADHGIFLTQIQLEHTRKFTFIGDELPLTPGFAETQPSTAADSGGIKTPILLPKKFGFGTKFLPSPAFEKNPMHASKDICGKIDGRIRFHLRKSESDSLSTTGDALMPRHDVDTDGDDDESGAGIPLVTTGVIDDDDDADDGDGNDDDDDDYVDADSLSVNGGSTANTANALPSITRGAWPWLAAIYVNNLTSLAYQCGGTLVSSRIVISSAHCFQMFKKRYRANDVLVFLGRHNLENWNEDGSVAAPVDDIFIHPEYDNHLNTYDADIALVVLKDEVRFNTFIRPACLWSGSSKSQYIEGEIGIVVGWGLGKANATTVPKIIDAPIVSNDVCFKSNDKFRSLSSNRTFCAGVVRGSTSAAVIKVPKPNTPGRKLSKSGPCKGDSGAGLMIFKNNRWMLRGTVSASLPIAVSVGNGPTSSTMPAGTTTTTTTTTTTKRTRCNVNQYVIYTDVAKYLNWIISFMV